MGKIYNAKIPNFTDPLQQYLEAISQLVNDLQHKSVKKTTYYDSILEKRISILKRIHLALSRERAREKVPLLLFSLRNYSFLYLLQNMEAKRSLHPFQLLFEWLFAYLLRCSKSKKVRNYFPCSFHKIDKLQAQLLEL